MISINYQLWRLIDRHNNRVIFLGDVAEEFFEWLFKQDAIALKAWVHLLVDETVTLFDRKVRPKSGDHLVFGFYDANALVPVGTRVRVKMKDLKVSEYSAWKAMRSCAESE